MIEKEDFPTSGRDLLVMAGAYIAIGFFLWIGFGVAKLLFSALF